MLTQVDFRAKNSYFPHHPFTGALAFTQTGSEVSWFLTAPKNAPQNPRTNANFPRSLQIQPSTIILSAIIMIIEKPPFFAQQKLRAPPTHHPILLWMLPFAATILALSCSCHSPLARQKFSCIRLVGKGERWLITAPCHLLLCVAPHTGARSAHGATPQSEARAAPLILATYALAHEGYALREGMGL